MRLATAVWSLALWLAGSGAAVLAAAAPEMLPAPISSRQTLFSIPFRIDPAAAGVAEVQLFVSVDRGETWQFHSRADPARASFLFRAPMDGEYCFSMQTVNRVGQPLAERGHRPGLRVIVDTTPPKLLLDAVAGQGGEVSLRWTIDEPNLKLESLVVQYRTNPYQAWQAVAVDRAAMASTGRVASGQVAWVPPGVWQRLEIRSEVGDTAGNTAVSHAQVSATREAQRPIPAAAETGPPAVGTPPAASPSPDAAPGSLPGGAASSSAPGKPEESPSPPAAAGGGLSIQIHPGIHNQYLPVSTPMAKVAKVGPLELPPGVRPRMVNTRRFQLEYDVESVGPSGIAQVELWGTRDGGQTWTSYGLDEDKRSPLVATVNDEGLFGFRVAVRSGAGLGGDPPKSGDPPDIWIGVDLTKPTCRILSAEQATGDQAGQLLIRWEAADWMPAEKPVALCYSPSRDGPWTAIATGLENTGHYAWTVEGRVPSRIYLRLEVRDEAGNLGIFETREAVSLDQLRPTVRIRQVRPFN